MKTYRKYAVRRWLITVLLLFSPSIINAQDLVVRLSKDTEESFSKRIHKWEKHVNRQMRKNHQTVDSALFTMFYFDITNNQIKIYPSNRYGFQQANYRYLLFDDQLYPIVFSFDYSIGTPTPLSSLIGPPEMREGYKKVFLFDFLSPSIKVTNEDFFLVELPEDQPLRISEQSEENDIIYILPYMVEKKIGGLLKDNHENVYLLLNHQGDIFRLDIRSIPSDQHATFFHSGRRALIEDWTCPVLNCCDWVWLGDNDETNILTFFFEFADYSRFNENELIIAE